MSSFKNLSVYFGIVGIKPFQLLYVTHFSFYIDNACILFPPFNDVSLEICSTQRPWVPIAFFCLSLNNHLIILIFGTKIEFWHPIGETIPFVHWNQQSFCKNSLKFHSFQRSRRKPHFNQEIQRTEPKKFALPCNLDFKTFAFFFVRSDW